MLLIDRKWLVAGALLLSSCAVMASASAPVKLIVPYPAGGGADGIARTIVEELSSQLNATVVIENKPGGSSTIGLSNVASAPANGHTLGLVNMAFTANPSLLKKMPFDAKKDFTPIGMVAKIPLVMAVHPSVKAKTVTELIEESKKTKQGIFYGSAGNGTSNHLLVERLKKMTGANWIHVPYRGGAPSVLGLVGNETSMVMVSPSSSITFFQSKKLRALAVGSSEKLPGLEDVPPLSQFVANFEAVDYYGLVGPAGMSAQNVAKINSALERTLQSPAVREKLRLQGNIPFHSTAEFFARFLADEMQSWSALIKDVGISLEAE